MRWFAAVFVVGALCCSVNDPVCVPEELVLFPGSVPSRLLKVEVFVLADDQGHNPLLSQAAALAQLDTLNSYFGCTGLKFSLKYTVVNSSFLLVREVLLACPLQQVGDGTCQPLCNSSSTNFDGGDCLPSSWPSVEDCELPSGECREHCNLAKFQWDHGRCCVPGSSGECRDPSSALCRLVEPSLVTAPARPSQWNIFIARVATDCTGCEPGLSSFPWQASNPTVQSSVLAHSSFLSPGSLLPVHELGHTLGLPDVSTGPCLSQSVEGEGLDCSGRAWTSKPHNAMGHSYLSGPECCTPAGAFSPLQCAVMRCHLARSFPSWRSQAPPLSEDVTIDSSPWGPLGIVGAAIAVAILIGICLGVGQAMKPEQKSRDEALSVAEPSGDNYTVM